MNKQPFFSVGEEVILQSKKYPEYDGEYVIEEVFYGDDQLLCRLTGEIIPLFDDGVYSYIFTVPLQETLRLDDNTEALFPESDLRKKHKPADESFRDMMNRYTKIPQRI